LSNFKKGRAMKEFMYLIRNKINHQEEWSSDKLHEFLKSCEEYILNLKNQGKLISAQPLMLDGKIISGTKNAWILEPFDKNNEVQVGYYHILAENLDEAISIAKQNPEFEFGSTARIEVRPVKTKEITTNFEYPKTAVST